MVYDDDDDHFIRVPKNVPKSKSLWLPFFSEIWLFFLAVEGSLNSLEFLPCLFCCCCCCWL